MSDKYYYLKKGEIIKEGDEVDVSRKYNENSKWAKANRIGEKAPDPTFLSHRVYRRIIK